MNNIITVIGITILSLLLASSFFLQTQNVYERNDIDKDIVFKKQQISDEATEQEEEAMEEAEEDNDDDDDDDYDDDD